MAVAAELLRGVSFVYFCVLFVAAPLAAAAVVARRLADARRGLARISWSLPEPPPRVEKARGSVEPGGAPRAPGVEPEALKVRAGYDAEAWRRTSEETRRRRIAHAEGRERVRSAIRPLAREGYYAFEDLLTDEAGAVDQLLVGPNGVYAVVVRSDRGAVWRRHSERRYYLDPSGGAIDAAIGATIYSAGRPFEEDLEQVVAALTADLRRKLFGGGEPGGGPVFHQLCFTEAQLAFGADPDCPHGGTPPDLTMVWHMADKALGGRYLVVAPEAPEPVARRDPGPLRYDPEEVEDLARAVAGIYDRRPWLAPESGEDA
jgi:hypothetical protein